MPEPINYLAAMPQVNPMGGLLEGLKTGALLRQNAEANAAADLREQQRIGFETDFKDYLSAPSSAKILAMQVKYPEMKDRFDPIVKSMDKKQLDNDLSTTSQVLNAIKAGKTDIAGQILDSHIEAGKNSGLDTTGLENIKSSLTTNPEATAGVTEFFMANLMGPDKYKNWADAQKTGVEKRILEETAPSTISEAASKADIAKSESVIKREEAKIAPDKFDAEKRQALATATTKEAEAKYAPKKYKLDTQKLGAEIGLTKAQIAQTRAMTSKTQQEIENLKKEGKGLVLDPEKRFNMTKKLRDEYLNQTGDFIKTQDAYNKIKAARPDGVGDISLIFSYMKMLDPGSVVREGEFATASNSAGIPAAVTNMYNKAMNGERLTDKQRADFKRQSEKLFNASAIREKQVRTGLKKVSSAYGLRDEEIFYNDYAPTSAPTQKPTTSGTKNVNPPAPRVPTKNMQSHIDEADLIVFGRKR